MRRLLIPIIAGIALSLPAVAQDAYHIRVGDRLYDIRTGSSDNGTVIYGCAYRLCHPNVVPMETAEPRD